MQAPIIHDYQAKTRLFTIEFNSKQYKYEHALLNRIE